MKKRAHHFTSTPRRVPPAPAPAEVAVRATLSTADLARYAAAWVQESVYRQLSPHTQDARRRYCGKLLWYLQAEGYEHCGAAEMSAFLEYLATGHTDKGGRWGQAQQRPDFAKKLRTAPRPRTLLTYFTYLRAFWSWTVGQGVLDASPMARLKAPPAAKDKPEPFTDGQIDALVAAARMGPHPARDQAIIWFLFDTGLRASEVCSLTFGDIDMVDKRCAVLGKGKKRRTVNFGIGTSRALWNYFREGKRDPVSQEFKRNEVDYALASYELHRTPLFLADRGNVLNTRGGLTRFGLKKLIWRLGQAAGIQRERCSPHTFRNTFAVNFLRSGGNVFTLKEILGHESLVMTNRYVAMAEADVAVQHRLHSPVDQHKKR